MKRTTDSSYETSTAVLDPAVTMVMLPVLVVLFGLVELLYLVVFLIAVLGIVREVHVRRRRVRGADEVQGNDTDQTAVNLFLGAPMKRIGLDPCQAQDASEGIGNGDSLVSHSSTARAVRNHVTSSVTDVMSCRNDWGKESRAIVMFGMVHGMSKAHIGGHSGDYDTDRIGRGILSKASADDDEG